MFFSMIVLQSLEVYSVRLDVTNFQEFLRLIRVHLCIDYGIKCEVRL